LITYYTQFSNFASRYGKACCPVMVGSSSYFYRDTDRKKTWPVEARADYYSTTPGFLKNFAGLFVVDIEHLDMSDPKSVEHLKFAVRMYRVRNPGLRIGIYSVLPKANYYAPVLWEKDLYWAGERKQWMKDNEALANDWNSLASCVDFVMPMLYESHATGDHSPDNWSKYASAQISEAARYRKPIIPALWPFFEHDPGQQYVGDNLVRRMIETCRNHRADVEGLFWWHQSDRIEPDSFYRILRSA